MPEPDHAGPVGAGLEFDEASAADADDLARLRRSYAAADEFDPHSTLEHLPPTADFTALADAGSLVVVRADSGPVGYGSVRSWDEGDELRVHLLDAYLAPGLRTVPALTETLRFLEQRACAEPSTRPRPMLAANATSVQPRWEHVLVDAGYQRTFDMVEMRLVGPCPEVPQPPGVTMRSATVTDAEPIAALIAEAWEGRPFHLPAPTEAVVAWVRRSNLELFQVAEVDGQVVGLVASTPRDGYVEIEDVAVADDHRRRGIAAALMVRSLELLAARSTPEIRLHTEGDDPVGALRLYRRLGFETIRTHHRYRRPVEPHA